MSKTLGRYISSESDRLMYRPLTYDDVPSWTPFFINNERIRFVGAHRYAHLSPEEKAHNWIGRQIDRLNRGQYGQLAVMHRVTEDFIGVGGIIERAEGEIQGFEITYSLLPSAWNKGYATELARHFKQYAEEHIPSTSLFSIIHVENEASMNVARKNGMNSDGRIHEFMGMDVFVFE